MPVAPMELITNENLETVMPLLENATNVTTFVNYFGLARYRIIDITFDNGTVFPMATLQ